MIVPFPLSQSDHQMQRVRSCVEQHRNAPFRSADWLVGELMRICETAPDNDTATQPATSQEGERDARLAHAKAWLCKRWSQEHPNAQHVIQLADYAEALAATPTPPTLSEDLREALAPFANVGELIEAETTGFADEHEFEVLLESGHLFTRLKVADFRAAFAALAQAKAS